MAITEQKIADHGVHRDGRSFNAIHLIAVFCTKGNSPIFTTRDRVSFIRQKTYSHFIDYVTQQLKDPNIRHLDTRIGHDGTYIEVKFRISPIIKPVKVIDALKTRLSRLFFKQYPDMKENLDGHLWNGGYGLFSVGDAYEIQKTTYLNHSKKYKVSN